MSTAATVTYPKAEMLRFLAEAALWSLDQIVELRRVLDAQPMPRKGNGNA